MTDLSNNSLALIVVMSIAIMLTGIFVVVNDTDFGVTGRIVDSSVGQAQLTVTSVTELTNQFSAINWGSGYIDKTSTSCTLDTEGGVSEGCTGFSTVSSGFLIENTGNTNVSVNYTSDKNAASFIGGTNPEFNIKSSPNSVAGQSGESSALDTQPSCENSWGPSSYEAITTGGAYLCGSSQDYSLNFVSSMDSAVIDVQVVIPEDASIEAKTATITFNAESD